MNSQQLHQLTAEYQATEQWTRTARALEQNTAPIEEQQPDMPALGGTHLNFIVTLEVIILCL
jgi:hypothetical protein